MVNIEQIINELRVSKREVADVTFCLRSRHQLYQCYIKTQEAALSALPVHLYVCPSVVSCIYALTHSHAQKSIKPVYHC